MHSLRVIYVDIKSTGTYPINRKRFILLNLRGKGMRPSYLRVLRRPAIMLD